MINQTKKESKNKKSKIKSDKQSSRDAREEKGQNSREGGRKKYLYRSRLSVLSAWRGVKEV